MSKDLVSPCISICKIDPVTGYCYGCARTNDEKKVWKDIKISEMVDHWNMYVNISQDELAHVKEFSSWMKKRASNENRVAAGFIFQYMISKYELVTIDENFPTILYEQVQPISTCANCHEKFYNQYSISKHKCFNVGKKRKQWSLAKNQKTRMKII